MWTLKICLGLFMGLCGSHSFYVFDTKEACYREQERLENKKGVTYAVCYPTPVEKK